MSAAYDARRRMFEALHCTEGWRGARLTNGFLSQFQRAEDLWPMIEVYVTSRGRTVVAVFAEPIPRLGFPARRRIDWEDAFRPGTPTEVVTAAVLAAQRLVEAR